MNESGHQAGELREVAVDWRSSRRAWLDRYLQALDRLLPGRSAESHPEVAVGDALAEAGVTGLVRQHEIELPGHGMARFDLALPELRWTIEIDAFPTHRETAGRRHDARRDNASIALGWSVTRLTPDDLGARFADTIDRLLAIHDDRRRAIG